ncbi:hypothetical protein O7623_05400 [Solwaraspora sp. WMMD791]|uniref:hypothetical protein n=1 Tax=Solwaraspora sp. WMMD791 TaxID=3016086 RepID=UPI002499F647|nr:hypothetical protein [Solwaraspora sp. WMMD791]WFE28639.1 hypothetical protein O7623_05400 [Solwaraspora sp. WMMD791]
MYSRTPRRKVDHPDAASPLNSRRWKIAGTVGLAAVIMGAGLGLASADTSSSADVGTIVCPSVADRLPAVPAAARAEVDRNLQQLQTQIDEANARLVSSQGQGGPNFVDNAILGPLEDKRTAALERIAISIGRQGARPVGLESLATCQLVAGSAAGGGAAAEPPATAAAPAGNGNGNNGNGANTGAGTIVCPSVADRLPAVPAAARAEVDRNLQQLQTQIDEANARLVSSQGQGGPNFVDNAILGPLEDKRTAALERIAISIGRQGARPVGLESLATCQLQG